MTTVREVYVVTCTCTTAIIIITVLFVFYTIYTEERHTDLHYNICVGGGL